MVTITPDQIPLTEYHDKKKERLAEMRLRNEIPLTYEDFEILSGIPRSTLENWRSTGRLIPLSDAEGRAPRFAIDELYRILGGGKHRDHLEYKDEQYDKLEATGHEQVADPVLLYSPADGQKDSVQGGVSRKSERSAKTKGPGKARRSGGKGPLARQGAGGGLHRLLCHHEDD